MKEEKKYGTECWICTKCNWFIYPSALEFQEKLGLQTYPWKCPECGNLLVEDDE